MLKALDRPKYFTPKVLSYWMHFTTHTRARHAIMSCDPGDEYSTQSYEYVLPDVGESATHAMRVLDHDS